MHLAPLIRDLAVILGVAALVTIIFQKIRQPVVLGYIIAGFIVGPFWAPFMPASLRFGPLVSDLPNIKVWAELGVIFLMFSLGLEFSFRKLARVGISAATTAGFEITFMLILGFTTGKLMGWSFFDSIFLAAMLSISSTTIIIKALDELKLKTRRFSQMIFGVLIVEDLVAVLILVALSTLVVSKSFSSIDILASTAQLVLVVGSWFLAGYFIVPRFVRYVGKLGNDEMLTILSIGLCLFLAVVAALFQYSVALGAFIMGSILAESTESYRIEKLIHPLRDLFAAIFFVSVGMLVDPQVLKDNLGVVFIISTVLIVGKIISITVGSLLTGQTLRTAVQVGFGMAQIGEFSFIIATLGQSLGATSKVLYPVAAAVSIITAFTTPYLIRISHRFAVYFEGRLPVRVRHHLSQYAAWTLERKFDSRRRSDFYKRTARWALNGIIITVVFITLGEFTRRYQGASHDEISFARSFGWALAMLISAPFLWAMFFAFRGFKLSVQSSGGGVIFMSRLLAVFWVGAVSLEFFTARLVLLVVVIFVGLMFVIFHRQLGSSYKWFEERFLSTFEQTPKSRKPADVFRHLAPWDAHLVRFKVHPNSEIAGQRLGDLDLRARYGLSVVVIQRGLKTIVAPQPQEQIFPKDELLVLGTDEEVDAARTEIEKPPGLAERFASHRLQDLSGYDMKQIFITEGSSLNGISIRDSNIRERCGGMVVGLERLGQRMVNPNASIILKPGDAIWIVGELDKLSRIKL